MRISIVRAFVAALVFAAGSFGVTALPALAGYQTCNGVVVPNSVRMCGDHSIPIYHAEELTPGPTARPVVWCSSGHYGRFVSPAAGRVDGRVAGRFALSVPGSVTSHVEGNDEYLRAHPSATGGYLTIRPDGTYSWTGGGHSSSGRLAFFEPNSCAAGRGMIRVALHDGSSTYYVIRSGNGIDLYNIGTAYLTYHGTPV